MLFCLSRSSLFSSSLRSPSSVRSRKASVKSTTVRNTASLDETSSTSSMDMVDIDEAMKRSESNPSTSTSQYADAGNKKPETFKEIMGFSGWAPEVINCRAGMIAFVAAMGAEMQSHETFFAQFHDHVFSLVFASLLITVASFMPSMQNADDYTSKPSSKPYGIFTPEAELTNGRAAIVGLLTVTIVEKIMGHGFFA